MIRIIFMMLLIHLGEGARVKRKVKENLAASEENLAASEDSAEVGEQLEGGFTEENILKLLKDTEEHASTITTTTTSGDLSNSSDSGSWFYRACLMGGDCMQHWGTTHVRLKLMCDLTYNAKYVKQSCTDLGYPCKQSMSGEAVTARLLLAFIDVYTRKKGSPPTC
eukprot:gnl/MRDRNA2_/MRDRNA2_91667_c0_seq1.p1 gnl/MRDRNA2_/MRDRNA2_91667_c0~~gnl/MRDRNA2_/MRDRNA2_91667_c0_seq1.p1  ORF type:complete len:166 (+),score=28.39 gnl/MRDRNA2_/MRDRNA2_91667_c0_seq1:78-575(+)